MLSKQLLTSLSFFVIFGAVHSEGDKSCIDAPPIEDFDAFEFYGHYYLTASDDESSTKFDCLQYMIWDIQENGTTPIAQFYRDKSDNSTHMLFQNIKIDWDGKGLNLNKHPFTIVATDYYDYMVVFTCNKNTNTNVVSVLMRTALPPDQTDFFHPQRVLDPYNIDIHSDLTFMNQQDCPTDWSDAKMDEANFTYDDAEEDLIAYIES